MPSNHYTTTRAVPAEGARIGFLSCERCGAALVLDEDDDVNVLELHDVWHMRVESMLRERAKGDGDADAE